MCQRWANKCLAALSLFRRALVSITYHQRANLDPTYVSGAKLLIGKMALDISSNKRGLGFGGILVTNLQIGHRLYLQTRKVIYVNFQSSSQSHAIATNCDHQNYHCPLFVGGSYV